MFLRLVVLFLNSVLSDQIMLSKMAGNVLFVSMYLQTFGPLIRIP
jgi:hypothetical protein